MARYRRAAGGGVHGGARLLRPAGRAVGGGAPARRHPARRAALADPVLLRAPARVPAHLDRAGRVARRAGGPARTLVPRRPRGPPRGAHRRGPRGGTGRHRAAVGQRGLRRRGHAADAGSRSRSGTVHRGRRPVAGERHLARRPARSHLPPPYLLPVLPPRRRRHVRRLPAARPDRCRMTADFVLLSTADTDLLAARASGVPWRVANPGRIDAAGVPALLDGAALVLVRLLGGRRTWPEGLAAVLAAGLPVVAVGGEVTPDAELTTLSSVPAGVAQDAQRYLVEGGPANLRELHRFLSDTVLLTGEGFAPPQPAPAFGLYRDRAAEPDRPTVGVVFYRAHALSGNTGFVDTLCAAVESAGANAGAVPDVHAGGVGGIERGAVPDGRGDAGGHPGVRRPADRRAVLVQGGRPGRHPGLRRRPRTGRAGGRHRRGVRPAAPDPAGTAPRRGGPLGLPDQARARRQRRGPRHPRVGRGAAAGAARRRLRHRRVPRGRRHAHPRVDRRGRVRHRVAHRGAARRCPGAGHAGAVPAVVRRATGAATGPDARALG